MKFRATMKPPLRAGTALAMMRALYAATKPAKKAPPAVNYLRCKFCGGRLGTLRQVGEGQYAHRECLERHGKRLVAGVK